MKMAVTVVQWLLVLALLVGHSQGQSETSITGLVDTSTLTEWGRFTGTISTRLSQDLGSTVERQFLFPGLRFRCSGSVTKWIVGASFGSLSQTQHPALGIYRDEPGGGAADRVGATVFVQQQSIVTRVYEFSPDPPLPFQTNDSLGIYLHPDTELRLRPLHRRIPGAPASRNYVPTNPTAEGVSAFNFTSAPNEETDRLPLLAVEIESDDPDSADCTSDFISRDLLGLLAYGRTSQTSQQIVFTSSNFTSDGNITSWTVAARWEDGTGRNRFPELQVWRRRSGDAYDRIASTALTATAESPNELYSGTIDPPLQFQSGDLLGMYIPPNADGGARLLVWFGIAAGSTYEFRSNRNAPLSAIILTGLETDSDNDRPFLALEISPEPDPTVPTTAASTTPDPTVPTSAASTTPAATAASTSIIPVPTTTTTGETSATPPTTGDPSASPPTTGDPSPTELLSVIVIAVGASAGGVVLAAVSIACARKKNQKPMDRSVDAINMKAIAEETYDYTFREPTAISTKRNEAYATIAITTEQNEAYASTAITTEQNEAYASTAITMEQNEAYATTAITTEQNEAYATTAITTEHNEAYATTAITTEHNEAYATTLGGDTATDDYEYI